jgi:hypothetical protein
MPQADFFISYTGADVKWARWIAWELERAGYTTIYQDRDFVPGRAFMQQMRKAAKESRRTIAVLSEAYFESKYAELELNAAITLDPLGDDRKLIPVRVNRCTPDALLKDRVYIDLVGVKPRAAARRLLLDGVRAATAASRRGTEVDRAPKFPGDEVSAESDEAAESRAPSGNALPVYPLRVLFLASEAGTGLDLRRQYRTIKRAIAASLQPKAIIMHGVFDVTASSFFEALNRYTPHVVHFSGKQDGGDILIHTTEGKLTSLTDRELAGMLRSLDTAVRVVIVDTCYSLPCAESIAQTVDFALGVKSYIYEDDATDFYSTFYQALAAGRSMENATAQAAARLSLGKVPRTQTPQLRVNRAADAKAVLVAKRPRPRRA